MKHATHASSNLESSFTSKFDLADKAIGPAYRRVSVCSHQPTIEQERIIFMKFTERLRLVITAALILTLPGSSLFPTTPAQTKPLSSDTTTEASQKPNPAWQHFDPHKLPVPFTGAPWYIELSAPPGRTGPINGTRGNPVSDYGSHFGFKANLWEHRPLYTGNETALALPGLSGKLDRSTFDVLDANGNVVKMNRHVRFESWGWRETLNGAGIIVNGTATTLTEDAFLLKLDIRVDRQVRLRFRVFADENTALPVEGFRAVAKAGRTEASVNSQRNELLVSRNFETADKVSPKLYRAYRFSTPITEAANTAGEQSYSFDVVTNPFAKQREVSVVLGWGLSAEQARERSAAGQARVKEKPNAAVRAVERDWRDFFAALPQPRGGARERELYRLANTALRMTLYAPRGNMPVWGAVPAKARFTAWWPWDTPLQAIGYADWTGWNPSWIDQSKYSLAEQLLLIQMRAVKPSGQILLAEESTTLRSDKEPFTCQTDYPSITTDTQRQQAPVQGWVAWEVARRDPDRERARRFLNEAYPVLDCAFNYWFRVEDSDHDGLVEHSLKGKPWDDTPRIPSTDKEPGDHTPRGPWTAVDTNSFLSLWADSMASIAKEIGRFEDAPNWKLKADNLAAQIDRRLWDEDAGGWLDRFDDQPIKVKTPALWWLAFASNAVEKAKAKRVIEQHLLNPREFFGTYPVPTVAYNDPAYNHEGRGKYWQGQIWSIPFYVSLVALERHGYHAEAEILKNRIIAMTLKHGGLHENYDALTGEVGFAHRPLPSVFQFAWTASLVNEMLLDRHRESPPGKRTDGSRQVRR